MRFSWYITWVKNILFNHEKDGNPAICENMDEPWEYYAKWDKSNGKTENMYIEKISSLSKEDQMLWTLMGEDSYEKRTSKIKRIYFYVFLQGYFHVYFS